MDATALLQWFHDHLLATIFLLVFLALVSSALDRAKPWLRVFPRYVLVIAAAWVIFVTQANILYFYAFLLGMLTAFSEIISKFTDEPIKALAAVQALYYHVLNGCVSAFALRVLLLYQNPETALDRLKAVVIAGLGAMLLLRSRLFNVKVGGEDLSFGPEQIVRVFFNYMELAIDRIRAQARIQFVRDKLDNIDFMKVRSYTRAMLGAAQTLNDSDLKKIDAAFDDIAKTDETAQVKSYAMGFVLLNEMGEDFVERVFDRPAVDWKIGAPDPAREGILSILGRDIYYFAYGGDMSSSKILERLNWSSYSASTANDLNPQKAVLKNYAIGFDHRSPAGAGLPNIHPQEGASVEGVLYKFPPSVMEFLDRINAGYQREDVQVVVPGDKDKDKEKIVAAHAYIAHDYVEGLAPTPEYTALVLQAARERKLSSGYISGLEKISASVPEAKAAANASA